jgi:hypothetical protein
MADRILSESCILHCRTKRSGDMKKMMMKVVVAAVVMVVCVGCEKEKEPL